jgi:sirohydrochlorin cobaltochelatase
MSQGLILLAHGARDPRWREPFERLAERIRSNRPEFAVRLAFLELMAPDLLLAGEELVADGCDTLRVVRIFLGQGGHVRDDVPALFDALRKRYAGIHVTLSRAAGEDGGVIDALASFCIQELEGEPADLLHLELDII